MLKVFIILSLMLSGSIHGQTGYNSCYTYVNTMTKSASVAESTCSKILDATTGPCGGGVPAGVTPARCLGAFYGLTAMGSIGLQGVGNNCGRTNNGAHHQCINMMQALCSNSSTPGGLCAWLLMLGGLSGDPTKNATAQSIYATPGTFANNTNFQDICYNYGRNTSILNPLVYSATTGCVYTNIGTEEN